MKLPDLGVLLAPDRATAGAHVSVVSDAVHLLEAVLRPVPVVRQRSLRLPHRLGRSHVRVEGSALPLSRYRAHTLGALDGCRARLVQLLRNAIGLL